MVDRLDTKWALLALAPLLALFLAVTASAYRHFDPAISGDYDAQVEYLRYIEEHRSVPRADQGFAFYHPPVYYAASVAAFSLLRPVAPSLTLTDAGRATATLAWLLEGVVAAIIVARLGGAWLGMAAAAAVVWLLPGQANVGTRLYPETMAGLGVALLVLGVVNLHRKRPSGYLWLGVGIPIAGLSKYSGLVAVTVVGPLALWAFRDRWARVAGAMAPGSALVAAFYGRNIALFGTPTPLNADLFDLRSLGGLYEHYPPGFFTRLSIGRCAGERSFYGSAWKWLWAVDCTPKPPWSETLGGWVLVGAVVATVVLAGAWVLACLRARRDPVWLCVAAIPLAVLCGFLFYNVRVPSGSTGLYLLVAIVPVAVAGGLLLSRARRDRARVAGYVGLLGWAAIMAQASGAV